MLRIRLLGAALLAGALLLAAPSLAAADATYDHVVVIVLENHTRSQITASSAPFLAGFGAQATADYAVYPSSLPNYIALTSGTTQGCRSVANCGPHSLSVANLFHQLGPRAGSLEESMPVPCDAANAGAYVVRHNPQVIYTDDGNCAATDLPLPADPAPLDVALAPAFTFVTPNQDHNMHSGAIATGDAWVAALDARIRQTSEWRSERTAVVVTFDEGTSSNENVYLAVDSNQGSAATDTAHATHADLLATIETVLGQPVLGPGDPSLLMPLFPSGAGAPPPVCNPCDPCDPTCPPPPPPAGPISAASETPAVATKNIEIDFTLSEPAPITAVVTDATGRTVKTLARGGTFAAGGHALRWGLVEDGSVPAPNGAYTATLSTPGEAPFVFPFTIAR